MSHVLLAAWFYMSSSAQFHLMTDKFHLMTETTDWTVQTTKQWMNLLAPIARPIFEWNHNVVMSWGATGLAKRLRASVVILENVTGNIYPPHYE